MGSWFAHPAMLWIAPLVALPIIIHLLNRLRYRRVRWAAIDFLLTTERRAVRRARLKQLLLMALRMLLLAAALMALAQPRFRGTIASLLGGSRQVAVLLDASASMSATGVGGSAFARGKRLIRTTFEALPRATRSTGGTFAVGYDSPFRAPLPHRKTVAAVLDGGRLTGGRGDVPRALRAAAESLARGDGGGAIWLLSDLQASGWRASDAGEWDEVRKAFERAGKPKLVITDLGPGIDSNLSIAGVRVSPAVLVRGDKPKLTVTVELRAPKGTGGTAKVALFFRGKRIDSRAHELAEPGRADVVFRLPELPDGVHAGRVELEGDALPSDDRFYFVLHTAARIPLLVVDGAPSSVPFAGAGAFVALAAQPPETDAGERSILEVESVGVGELGGLDLAKYKAICLCDVPRLDPEALELVREYTTAGGLLIVFPGQHTDQAAWNQAGFPPLPLGGLIESAGDRRIKLGHVAQTHPITATLPAEGLDAVLISRLYRLETDSRPAETLIHTERGEPFLVGLQVGKGRAYVYAVSAQEDFSNLPFTRPFLITLHRAVRTHLIEAAAPLAQATYSELKLALPTAGTYQMVPPSADAQPVPLKPSGSGDVTFGQTQDAGIYRLMSGAGTPKDRERVPPVAALNVPAEESELERIDRITIGTLLPGITVAYRRGDGRREQLGETTGTQSAASGFPLAVFALLFLIGEVLLAWSMGRPGVVDRSAGNGGPAMTSAAPVAARAD